MSNYQKNKAWKQQVKQQAKQKACPKASAKPNPKTKPYPSLAASLAASEKVNTKANPKVSTSTKSSFFLSALYAICEKKKPLFLLSLLLIALFSLSFLFTSYGIFYSFSHLDSFQSHDAIYLAVLMLIALLYAFITNWGYNYIFNGLFFKVFSNYRKQIAATLRKASLGDFTKHRLAALEAAFTTSMSEVENYSNLAVTMFVPALVAGLLLSCSLLSLNLKIGCLALVAVIGDYLIFYFSSKKIGEFASQHLQANDNLSDTVIQTIRGISVLRSFPLTKADQHATLQAELQTSLDKLANSALELEKRYAFANASLRSFNGLACVALLLVCAFTFSASQLGLAAALTIAVIVCIMFESLNNLVNVGTMTHYIPRRLNQIKELLELPELASGKLEKVPEIANLEFKDVTFAYPKGATVLKNCNLFFEAQKHTALVGPSGSGKTTIINLIARFYEPQAGQITLGGQALNAYSNHALMSQLSLVFQDVYLFNDTIRNNIRFAKPDASEEAVIKAAKLARCHDFIMALPAGYDTVVGDNGARFSGGERQRLSIARAFLKDAPIILLDEATSSIDPENEAEIMAALADLAKGKTVISIAHRLSTVEAADQIIVITNGQAIAKGTHQELLATCPLYQNFVAAKAQTAKWQLNTV